MQGDEIRALRRLQREQGREKLAARVGTHTPATRFSRGSPQCCVMRARLEPRPTSTPDGVLVRENERRSCWSDVFTRRSAPSMGKVSVRAIQSPLPAKLFRQPTGAALHVRE